MLPKRWEYDRENSIHVVFQGDDGGMLLFLRWRRCGGAALQPPTEVSGIKSIVSSMVDFEFYTEKSRQIINSI
jgi:hypothetical protein